MNDLATAFIFLWLLITIYEIIVPNIQIKRPQSMFNNNHLEMIPIRIMMRPTHWRSGSM